MRRGTLGAFARAFSMNYSGPDGAVHAWVALPNAGHRWQYVSIDGVTEEPAIPGQSADVLYLGQPVASYLTAHPDAAATPDTVFTTLRGWGLEATAAVGVGLDGAGPKGIRVPPRALGCRPLPGATGRLVPDGPSGCRGDSRHRLHDATGLGARDDGGGGRRPRWRRHE